MPHGSGGCADGTPLIKNGTGLLGRYNTARTVFRCTGGRSTNGRTDGWVVSRFCRRRSLHPSVVDAVNKRGSKQESKPTGRKQASKPPASTSRSPTKRVVAGAGEKIRDGRG